MAQKPPTLPQMPFPGRLHFRPANGAAAESPACLFPPPAAAARPSPGGEGAPVCKLGRMRWEATEGKTPHHRCAELPLKGKPINPETCTKETAKQLIAVFRTYYTFDVFARNKGLCPHMKNRPLGGRMFIFSSPCNVFLLFSSYIVYRLLTNRINCVNYVSTVNTGR